MLSNSLIYLLFRLTSKGKYLIFPYLSYKSVSTSRIALWHCGWSYFSSFSSSSIRLCFLEKSLPITSLLRTVESTFRYCCRYTVDFGCFRMSTSGLLIPLKISSGFLKAYLLDNMHPIISKTVTCTLSASSIANSGVIHLCASDFYRYFAKPLDKLYSFKYCNDWLRSSIADLFWANCLHCALARDSTAFIASDSLYLMRLSMTIFILSVSSLWLANRLNKCTKTYSGFCWISNCPTCFSPVNTAINSTQRITRLLSSHFSTKLSRNNRIPFFTNSLQNIPFSVQIA
jgi:hypothetical protein